MTYRSVLLTAFILLLGSLALMQDSSENTISVTGITLSGQEASVPAECEAETTQTAKVVCAANVFLATLSDEQKTEVVLDLTQENAVRWSNFPTPFGERNGIRLSTLDTAQQTAAEAVVKTAMGEEGYNKAMQIRMADDVVASFGSGGGNGGQVEFSSGAYFLAFLGTPSTTDTWILQFGGHHLAFNVTYKAGEIASATPLHTGVEPKSWTTEDGTTYAPLNNEHDTMAAMLASLDETQLASAQLSSTFSDVLVGPQQDGQFPATKEGLAVSNLSDEQKVLVLAAIQPWVQNADDATAVQLLAIYEEELNDTYIAFSGDPGLTNNADYARLDGPSVWIELACQSSDIDPDGIHYHTIWRDHTRDYGAEFSF
jgi:hypothetical protein